MEYCPHGNLMERLVANGQPGLPLDMCARAGGEILLATEHLHRIRVIFRDMKPENIVFDAEGRCKITDFGLAKKLGPEESANTACGTEGYAAPELIARTGNYSFSVDIYSFGVLMYLILAGGFAPTWDPKKRLPPSTHVKLRHKIRNLPSSGLSWTQASTCAVPLLVQLTAGESSQRPTATEAKEHRFFSKHIGHPVDDLLPVV